MVSAIARAVFRPRQFRPNQRRDAVEPATCRDLPHRTPVGEIGEDPGDLLGGCADSSRRSVHRARTTRGPKRAEIRLVRGLLLRATRADGLAGRFLVRPTAFDAPSVTAATELASPAGPASAQPKPHPPSNDRIDDLVVLVLEDESRPVARTNIARLRAVSWPCTRCVLALGHVIRRLRRARGRVLLPEAIRPDDADPLLRRRFRLSS